MKKKNNKDNITYLKESKYIIQNREKLIRSRKRKRTIIRIVFISILLISAFLTLLFKLPYFNIKNIVVVNNKNVTKSDIMDLSNFKIGSNIFYINTKESVTNILSNPYILNVDIKRKLPNQILIKVNERKATFYAYVNKEYYIIDEKSMVLEKKEKINFMQLVKIIGFDSDNLQVGQPLPCNDDRKKQIIRSITDIINSNNNGMKMSVVDIKNVYDIKAYYGNICIKLGNESNLKDKFNKAINIIQKQGIKNKKGYIDVSFKGNPVFFIEK
ncbi:cell division protein FtsQ/DivIB [Haloimpatiens sp. FM7330]